MYSMKRQICKKRKEVVRAVSVLLLLSVFFPPVLKAQTTTYTKAESFLFSFKESSDMFLADYGDNAYQLERMGQRAAVICWSSRMWELTAMRRTGWSMKRRSVRAVSVPA